MLVDVVRLRRAGVRLPPEEVKQATPLRGQLQLGMERSAAYYRVKYTAPLLAGVLRLDKTEWALPPLCSARVMKINSRGMLIVGLEELSIDGGRHFDRVRQAWWVRVVNEPTQPDPRRTDQPPAP